MVITNFFKKLPSFVDAIELIDDPELYPLHADFYSRLALSFDHGEYSGVEAFGESKKIAEKLYRKSLQYHPVPRSYLGIGMLRQKDRDLAGSMEWLSAGVKHFPDDELINTCLAISYMNLGQFNIALSCLLKFQESPQALHFIAACYQELHDHENEAAARRKLSSLQQGGEYAGIGR